MYAIDPAPWRYAAFWLPMKAFVHPAGDFDPYPLTRHASRTVSNALFDPLNDGAESSVDAYILVVIATPTYLKLQSGRGRFLMWQRTPAFFRQDRQQKD
jgi:hypothetical protein